MQKVRKAVIPAAGHGTRFLPVTKAVPKEMLAIIDKPALHYIVKEAADSGIEEVLIVISPEKQMIGQYFGSGETECVAERELNELLGLQFEGLDTSQRLFLPEDMRHAYKNLILRRIIMLK